MEIRELSSAVKVSKGGVEVKDRKAVTSMMDRLIYEAVFADDERKKGLLLLVKEIAKACGAVPASIQGLYEEMGKNYPGFTVPAMNIRGLTYDVCRTIFRKAMEMQAGAFTFEIARSEIGYTKQRPLEYAAVVLAAAAREGYQGPVFIQGDHFQLVRKNYLAEAVPEVNYVKGLIQEAVEAEFYNIDVDTSTIVDIDNSSASTCRRSSSAGLFAGIGYFLDPLFHKLGLALLTVPGLETIWTAFYNATMWRVERFNNTVVMGALFLGSALFVPLYFLFNACVRYYRKHVYARVQNLKIMKLIKGNDLYQR